MKRSYKKVAEKLQKHGKKSYEKSYLLSQCLMKKDLIVVYFIIGVFCALNSICRLKWNKRVPFSRSFVYFPFFSHFQATIRIAFFFLFFLIQPCTQIHETNLVLKVPV